MLHRIYDLILVVAQFACFYNLIIFNTLIFVSHYSMKVVFKFYFMICNKFVYQLQSNFHSDSQTSLIYYKIDLDICYLSFLHKTRCLFVLKYIKQV